jgi:hypothetical protein
MFNFVAFHILLGFLSAVIIPHITLFSHFLALNSQQVQ